MTMYHAVLIGEDGMEFGADHEAASKDEAREWFYEQYPESRVVQLESPEDAREREATLHDLIRRGADFDEDGRPFFPNGDADDDYLDDDDDYLDDDEDVDDYEPDDPENREPGDDVDDDLLDLIGGEFANHANYCSTAGYDRWEREVAIPALEAKGYEVLSWWTEEGDSFGPLIRGVRIKKGDVTEVRYYG